MFIFSNLATSIDGKIASNDRSFFPIGTPYDRKHMVKLRSRCDAILIGASTLRCFKKPSLASKSQKQPINIILSKNLDGISFDWPFFQSSLIRRLFFVDKQIPKNKLRHLRKFAEVYVLKKPTAKQPIAVQIVDTLTSLGVKRLLIEGGGNVMWHFVRHHLIDEYHVTLTPKLIGGETAPTLVDGEGFATKNILSLRLHQCRRLRNELYLTYRKR